MLILFTYPWTSNSKRKKDWLGYNVKVQTKFCFLFIQGHSELSRSCSVCAATLIWKPYLLYCVEHTFVCATSFLFLLINLHLLNNFCIASNRRSFVEHLLSLFKHTYVCLYLSSNRVTFDEHLYLSSNRLNFLPRSLYFSN